MVKRLKRACRKPFCSGTTTDRSGYCDKHKAEKKSGWGKWQEKKGSDTERGYGWAWRKVRAVVLKRDKGLCQMCLKRGVITSGNTVDHIKPKALGGSDELDNLQTLCPTCHHVKTATDRRK